MKLITAEQRTPEWFAARLGKATASNFGNVLAAKTTAAYRNYRVKLALERLTGKQEDVFQSDAMRQGTEQEPIARAADEAKHEPMRPAVYVDGDYGCSLDGINMDEDTILAAFMFNLVKIMLCSSEAAIPVFGEEQLKMERRRNGRNY